MTSYRPEKVIRFRQWDVFTFYLPEAQKGTGSFRDISSFGMVGTHCKSGEHFNCTAPIWMLNDPLLQEWRKLLDALPNKENHGLTPDFDNMTFRNGAISLPLYAPGGLKVFEYDITVPPAPNFKALHEVGQTFQNYKQGEYHPEAVTKLAYYYTRTCNGNPHEHWKTCGCAPFKQFELAVNVRIDDWHKRLG